MNMCMCMRPRSSASPPAALLPLLSEAPGHTSPIWQSSEPSQPGQSFYLPDAEAKREGGAKAARAACKRSQLLSKPGARRPPSLAESSVWAPEMSTWGPEHSRLPAYRLNEASAAPGAVRPSLADAERDDDADDAHAPAHGAAPASTHTDPGTYTVPGTYAVPGTTCASASVDAQHCATWDSSRANHGFAAFLAGAFSGREEAVPHGASGDGAASVEHGSCLDGPPGVTAASSRDANHDVEMRALLLAVKAQVDQLCARVERIDNRDAAAAAAGTGGAPAAVDSFTRAGGPGKGSARAMLSSPHVLSA